MMLFWPTVSGLGFLLLAGLVIALGVRSTARYEFERNRVQGQQQQAAVPGTAVPGTAAPGPVAPHRAGPGAVVTEHAPEGAAGSVATMPQARPAGRPLAGGSRRPGGWWPRRTTGWSPVPSPTGSTRTGPASPGRRMPRRRRCTAPAPDGGVTQRQTPDERAWLVELGDQLDRLPEDWDTWLDDDDPTVTMVVEVAAALVEAGLPVHDCAGSGTAGGVCLTPEPACAGVLVSWHQHDRMSRDQVHGAGPVTAVQRTMNAAVAECLERLGFLVAPIGSSGCSVVTDARASW
ncbi:hypothetical protein A7K94_0213805 [Modestobacter sp. VKM Ac-2676]|nr:hypothetical protein A7K94_0213805 [Modestobacter sp. VKM Ac-2676]